MTNLLKLVIPGKRELMLTVGTKTSVARLKAWLHANNIYTGERYRLYIREGDEDIELTDTEEPCGLVPTIAWSTLTHIYVWPL